GADVGRGVGRVHLPKVGDGDALLLEIAVWAPENGQVLHRGCVAVLQSAIRDTVGLDGPATADDAQRVGSRAVVLLQAVKREISPRGGDHVGTLLDLKVLGGLLEFHRRKQSAACGLAIARGHKRLRIGGKRKSGPRGVESQTVAHSAWNPCFTLDPSVVEEMFLTPTSYYPAFHTEQVQKVKKFKTCLWAGGSLDRRDPHDTHGRLLVLPVSVLIDRRWFEEVPAVAFLLGPGLEGLRRWIE